ncbi:MAG: hypothetical protein C0180_02095 [Aciduliprofundum sp.]|nr:MAG: hypothetical protein C0180_02095 [Aciduliprofundum sp.]
MRLIVILPAVLLLLSPIAYGYHGVYSSGNISLSYDQYGNIFNVTFRNSILIDEIEFSDNLQGSWEKTHNGLVFKGNGAIIDINSIGIISIKSNGVMYSVEIPEYINITKAITFNGVISESFIMRYSGNFDIQGHSIESNSSLIICLNSTNPMVDTISSPMMGGIVFMNDSSYSDFILVNHTFEGKNTITLNFNGSPMYFIFIFQGNENNYSILLNGKSYSNYSVESNANSTIYSVLVPPGENTITFVMPQSSYIPNIIEPLMIIGSIALGVLVLYWVRRK